MALTDLDVEDLVELYGAATSLEGQRIALFLEEEKIEAVVRETTLSSFPSPADAHYLVCVKGRDRDRARTLIEAARADGAISSDGAFL